MLLKILIIPLISLGYNLFFSGEAWAWGPAIHTVIACKILSESVQLLPAIAEVIRAFPLEYLYGSLAADFFVGKGQKKKKGHSHSWETAHRFMKEAVDDQEAAYAWGFFSHLAADVIAHNYFVPKLIQEASSSKRVGHIYWEARADYTIEPAYIKIARDVLSMDHLGCDDLLRSAVGKRKKGLRARKSIFTQSVKLTDYLRSSPSFSLVYQGSRYRISEEYITFMVHLSYRLVRDILKHPVSSTCLSYDPIGSRNLRLAGRFSVLSKVF
ncbi:MAG: zinc dependent phospholipase C family protein, partial [Pseudomonadota bacterium]